MANPGEDISGSDIDPDYLKHVVGKNQELLKQLREAMGDKAESTSISKKRVHEKAKISPTGNLTIFCRYFFTKYVSNRLRQDTSSGMLNNYASIFPFQVKLELDDRMPELGSEFSTEIKEFVEMHFGNDCDVDVLKNLFWANINDFQATHFPNPPSLNELTSFVGGHSQPNWRLRNPLLNCDYPKNFIRLSKEGVSWYMSFQTKFNLAFKAYGNQEIQDLILPQKIESYFEFLPEINCCELLLLLEMDFYREDKTEYTRLFKKYLFFFKNASDRQDHPVCFIDETLFACLQFKREYETFREDKTIYDYEWELCMMILVHCRRYPFSYNLEVNLKPDRSDLENVVTYADQLLVDVERVDVYYSEPQYPRFKIFTVLDDTAFLISYNSRGKHSFSDRIGQILKSALVRPEIKKLKYYNAYLGEEETYEMPQQKEKICSFIRQLSKTERDANRLEPRHPLKFLIPKEVRKYFVNIPAIPTYV